MRKFLYALLALVLLAAPSAARKRVAQISVESARQADAYYLESVRQRLAGHRDAAFELLTECLRLNPDQQEALFDLANIKLSFSAILDSDIVQEGDSLLRRAYEVDTTNADIRERLAYHCLMRGDYSFATQLFERICQTPNPESQHVGALIQLYEIQAQYPKALATVDRMEMIEGPDALSAWERYEIYNCMGEREKAVATYDSLLQKAMPDPTTPQYVRDELMRHPRYFEKVKSLRDSLIMALKNPLETRIIACCREGQIYEPEFLPYYYYEGVFCQAIKDQTAAVDACRRGLNQITPESDKELVADLYMLAGDLYAADHNPEAAIEAYEEGLKIDSMQIMILNNYAYQLSLIGRNLDRAAELSKRTLAKEPTNATFLDTYAWILYRQGRKREARQYIDKAFKYCDDIDDEMREHRKAIYSR